MGFVAPNWAAEPTHKAHLTTSNTEVDVSTASSTVFGRDTSAGATIAIDNPSISKRHAAIVHHSDGRIYLIDLQSREGTRINGSRIPPNKPIKLTDGVTVQFGSNEPMRFACPEMPSPTVPEEGKTAQKVRASHLLVKHCRSRRPSSWKEDVVVRSPEEALELIKSHRRMIVDEGVPFEIIAQSESHCSSAKNGGDLGFFGKGQMQQQFEDVAFSLEVGQLSNPVWTDSGVHLILRTA
jgi:peptidyl-prolyl cis-trans isomerase NIMA-interacting 1